MPTILKYTLQNSFQSYIYFPVFFFISYLYQLSYTKQCHNSPFFLIIAWSITFIQGHIQLNRKMKRLVEINADEIYHANYLQWVLEGKKEIQWEKGQLYPGQSTSCLYHCSPIKSFKPNSSSFSPHILDIMSSEIYTLLVQQTVY